MLKKGDSFKITISGYGSNGEGVGKFNDFTVFVPFVIVGEVVEVVADFVKGAVCFAKLKKVVVPSKSRLKPPCKYFEICGGCQLQHMDYDAQLTLKKSIVENNLRKIGGLSLDVCDVEKSPKVYGYRNKISLPVRRKKGGKKGEFQIGLYRQNSHDLVEIDNCLLTENWAQIVLNVAKKWILESSLEAYDEGTYEGEIRHVQARMVDGQLLCTVVANGGLKGNTSRLVELLGEKFSNFGLFVNINTQKNNVILGKETQHIFGLSRINSSEFSIQFSILPDSFFQVNDGVRIALYSSVKQLLDTAKIDAVVDCFSGVGILSAMLYSDNFESFAIEIEPAAVDDANNLKRQNNLKRLTNICGDVNVELPKLMEKLKEKNTALVFDPPRKGLGEGICQTILQNPPQQIVYISCDSATLARDLKFLSSKYTPTLIKPFDMFPQTRHVETLICLQRKP